MIDCCDGDVFNLPTPYLHLAASVIPFIHFIFYSLLPPLLGASFSTPVKQDALCVATSTAPASSPPFYLSREQTIQLWGQVQKVCMNICSLHLIVVAIKCCGVNHMQTGLFWGIEIFISPSFDVTNIKVQQRLLKH